MLSLLLCRCNNRPCFRHRRCCCCCFVVIFLVGAIIVAIVMSVGVFVASVVACVVPPLLSIAVAFDIPSVVASALLLTV